MLAAASACESVTDGSGRAKQSGVIAGAGGGAAGLRGGAGAMNAGTGGAAGMATAGSVAPGCPPGTQDLGGSCIVPLPVDTCAGKPTVECGCDLSGTFLVQTVTQLHWDPVLIAGQVAIAAGQAAVKSWGVWTFAQDGNAITATARGCGGEVPEICSPLLMEAYAQGIPDAVWENPAVPRDHWELTLQTSTQAAAPATLAGGPHAAFFGLRLADGLDPLGAFPASSTDPSIVWMDDDADGEPATTSVVRGGGGASPTCGYPFAFPPVEQQPLNPARASKVRGGVRSIQSLSMTVDSCDLLHGSLVTHATSGRVQGCTLDDGAPCSAAQVAFVDSQPQTQKIDSAAFVLVRAAQEPATCAEVRAAAFPP